MSWLDIVWLLCALSCLGTAFFGVWGLGYRAGLACRPATAETPGEGLGKVLDLLGSRHETRPVLGRPERSPCPPCQRAEHRACHGGWLDVASHASCGCGCPDFDFLDAVVSGKRTGPSTA